MQFGNLELQIMLLTGLIMVIQWMLVVVVPLIQVIFLIQLLIGIMSFIKQHIDCDKLYKGAMEKKVKVFYEALKWELPIDKKNTLAVSYTHLTLPTICSV